MINDQSVCSKTFVYDLNWNTPDLNKIEKRYSTDRREIILPVFLYSLSRLHSGYSMPLFFKANEETEKILDLILSADGMEHLDASLKDDLGNMFYIDIQLLASRLSFKTRELSSLIEHPNQLKNVRLIGRTLYVTVIH